MSMFRDWWSNDLSKWVKFTALVLLANALPAFIILMTMATKTETWFVWTIKPALNARLVGVMYSNAIILIAIAAFQKSWARVRICMVVITLFSVFATVLTFFYLKPFLAHPWYHLTYWLTMYLVLFFTAPYVFLTHEKREGGRLPIDVPLNGLGMLVAAISMVFSLVFGLGLIFRLDAIQAIWPWTLPPLVAGLIGVLFTTHAAAFAWSLWDRDWQRVRPMFWQAPPTALGFLILPFAHASDLPHPDPVDRLWIYYAVAGLGLLAHLGVILSHRAAEARVEQPDA